MRLKLRTKCDGCGFVKDGWIPLHTCPRCQRSMMNRTDWLIYALWLVLLPFLATFELGAMAKARFRGETAQTAHVVISSRGDALCLDCGKPWEKDHGCKE